jgi:hypothetical protein
MVPMIDPLLDLKLNASALTRGIGKPGRDDQGQAVSEWDSWATCLNVPLCQK